MSGNDEVERAFERAWMEATDRGVISRTAARYLWDAALAARPAAPPAAAVEAVAWSVWHDFAGTMQPTDPVYFVKEHAEVAVRKYGGEIRPLYTTPPAREAAANADAARLNRELIARIQSAINEVNPPEKLTESKAEYWKAGARAAVHAINGVLYAARATPEE